MMVGSRVKLRCRGLKVEHEVGGEFPWVDLFIENCLYGIAPAFRNVKDNIRMKDTISSLYICRRILRISMATFPRTAFFRTSHRR